MSVAAYIALGSNLGERRKNIERAVQRLGPLVTRRSSVYETAPVGGPAGQGAYLNAVVAVET